MYVAFYAIRIGPQELHRLEMPQMRSFCLSCCTLSLPKVVSYDCGDINLDWVYKEEEVCKENDSTY